MKRRAPLRYERRIVLLCLAAVIPLAATALLLAFSSGISTKAMWTIVFLVLVSLFVATYVLHEQLVYPLRTLSNLVTALREEDYSLRPRGATRDDALGDVLLELDRLRASIQARKIEALDATALLRAVLAEIDAAIFTFDDASRLRLVNRAGEKLLALSSETMIGRTIDDIGLNALIQNASGRWSIRRTTFRENGIPHQLLVIADIRLELREGELQAWQRIVRVLGHELNNSLAPIKSISTSMEQLITRDPLPDDWRDDAARGMRVIANRAEALSRFTRAYAQLARLPRPQRSSTDVAEILTRVAALETRVAVRVAEGPRISVGADPDQLEQLLINIVRNAADASIETGGGVTINWRSAVDEIVVEVEDEGLGLGVTTNLFVPFFTTKPNGSGIGLVLSRQIAEAHGGTLTLKNRRDKRGAVATLRLPTSSSPPRAELTSL
jgi:nitrogen fixation/metabolism regulation signal transduction histidine kinase